MVVSAIFGAGMASQKFINGFQTRLRGLEKDSAEMKLKLNSIVELVNDEVITIPDFRREQEICQKHLADRLSGIEISLNRLLEHALSKHD